MQAQKKQNEELLAKIAQLEANNKPPCDPEPSKTEQLLQQTLLRMNALESQLNQSKHDKEKEDPVGKASMARDTRPHDEPQPTSEHDDNDGSSGDEDDEYITTPSGRTVPLISIYSFSQCPSRPCFFLWIKGFHRIYMVYITYITSLRFA